MLLEKKEFKVKGPIFILEHAIAQMVSCQLLIVAAQDQLHLIVHSAL
jgi:hypothetical protein